MDSISLLPIFNPLLLTAVFGVLCALLLIGPGFRVISTRQRTILTLLRATAIGLALLASLRPGCTKTTQRQQSAVLMFLLDVSRSMDLPHITDDSTRYKALREMLNANQAKFRALADNKIDVRFFAFDSQAFPLETAEGLVALPAKPEGTETDLGTPIFNVGKKSRGERLIGMVLASDGMQTVLSPEVEMAQAIDTLKDLELPLYCVKFGLPGESGQLADVSVKNFAQQHVVNVKNNLNASATVVARGYANETIKVELVLIDRSGQETIVGEPVFVTPKSAFEETNIRLSYTPLEPGEFRIKVRAVPMEGELAKRNNELDAFLSVNDKGMRILYLNGSLGFEQSALRRSLASADFIEVDFRWISSKQRLDMEAVEKAFSDPSYDIFVLDDVDARLLQRDDSEARPLDALAKSIENGKGLLMIGGTHSFGAGAYANTRLADVIPVRMKRSEKQDFGKDVRRELHINRELKLVPTRDHYLTRLGDDGIAAWDPLPPLTGANRFDEVKDNAVVLLRSADEAKHPVLIEANVGGRVIAFAGDSTHRWNFFRLNNDPKLRSFSQEFDQFWRQVILRLAFWDTKTGESVSIDLPQRRFQPRPRIRFGVSAQTAQGAPMTDVAFEAALLAPDGTKKKILIQQSNGQFFGQIEPDLVSAAGLYKIMTTGLRSGVDIGSTERDFVVMDRDIEKANPVADPDRLVRLSNETKDFGGKAIEPDDLAALMDEFIAAPPVPKIDIPTTWRIGETATDSTAFLLFFVAVIGTEWFLRKKWELV